jgi:hypothetical protein
LVYACDWAARSLSSISMRSRWRRSDAIAVGTFVSGAVGYEPFMEDVSSSDLAVLPGVLLLTASYWGANGSSRRK